MSFPISKGFLFYRFLQFFSQVDTRLISQTEQYPKHISHLFAHVVFLASFEALIAIFASHHTSQFTHFLCLHSHVGKLREISHSICLNPLVYSILRLTYRHSLNSI